MAKGLASFSKGEVRKVVARRLAAKTGGLGYLAAKDAAERIAAQDEDTPPETAE